MKQQILIVLFLTALFLVVPFVMVFLDFISGIRKAKLKNKSITADKMSISAKKLGTYYNALFYMLMVDIILMGAIAYLDYFYGYKIPLFPVFTFLGSLCVGAIELKSMRETADIKEKKEIDKIDKLGKSIISNKFDPKDIALKIMEYLEER